MQKSAVLIIDDELGPRESLKIILQDEYRIRLAPGGREGLEILKTEEIETVILDIRMPNLNGIEVFKLIRELDDSLPVIILTGFGSLSSAKEAVRLGAFDYLSKPFDVDDLKRIVDAAVKKRRLEVEAKSGLEELRQLNRELKQGLEKSSRLASVGTVSAALLHEIKNPLAVILGYVELLADQMSNRNQEQILAPGELEKYVAIIKREIERCSIMAKKYLEFSSLKRDETRETDLGDLMEESLELIELQAKRSGIRIERKASCPHPLLICHRDMIKQVFINVGLNALEALSPGGKLTAGVSRSSKDGVEWLEAIFEDTGVGITADLLPRIFDPYNSKGKGPENTGLGLAISRKIVTDHGGEIEISSRPGAGTRVRIFLPVSPFPPEGGKPDGAPGN